MPKKPLSDLSRMAKIIDQGMLDFLWVADESPSYGQRDAYVTLTHLALTTKRVKLGPGISNPYSRNITMAAYEALTLEELIPGRTVFGLGPGGSIPFVPLKIPVWNRPIKAMSESFQLLRSIFNGEETSMEGEFAKANKVKSFLGKVAIPIYLAARGQQMLRLAGQHADGTLLAAPTAYMEFVRSELAKGAEISGRDYSKIDVGCILSTALSNDPKEARRLALHSATLRTSDSPAIVMEKTGIGLDEQDAVRRAFREKGEAEAIKHVTDKMIDTFTVAGDVEHCVKKCRQFIEAGVTQVLFGDPFGADPVQGLETICGQVVPAVKAELGVS
jgi:5,10-methylenetetrahydromethanopterin reductase